MKKIVKRFAALICCLLLAFSIPAPAMAAPTENCPGSCAHAAAIGTTHYDTLAEAIDAAADADTVVLLTDHTCGTVTLGKAITLDLGGKTLTGSNAATEALLNASKDLTIKNGTLSAPLGTALLATDCAVTIDKTASILAAGGNAIQLQGSGKLSIPGGKITAKSNAIVLNVADGKTIEISITGGTFTVQDGQTIVATTGTGSILSQGFVIGGTFNKVPTDYVPAYCRITDNGDGTYTVTAQYNVSFSPNGGSGSMSSVKYDRGTTINLPACTLTAPNGSHFAGWQIGENTFAPGATYAVNGDLALKALWAKHTGGQATCCAKAVCSACGVSYGSYAGHSLTTYGATAPTCTQSGMNNHTRCSTCGQYFVSGVAISASSLSIPALGHDMQSVAAIPATCTEDGVLAHEICKNCELILLEGESATAEQLIQPATGHETEAVAAVAATCTQPGVKAHEVCTHCGMLFLNAQEVTEEELSTPVDTHLLSDWQQDESTHWKSCTQCAQVFRQHSHDDADGDQVCDDCGYTIAAAAEAAESQQSAEKKGFPFWIPVAVAVVAAAAVTIVIKKKSG